MDKRNEILIIGHAVPYRSSSTCFPIFAAPCFGRHLHDWIARVLLRATGDSVKAPFHPAARSVIRGEVASLSGVAAAITNYDLVPERAWGAPEIHLTDVRGNVRWLQSPLPWFALRAISRPSSAPTKALPFQ